MDDITPVLNGQILQGVDEFGVRWKTTLLSGWWDSTETTGNTYPNQMSDGGWVDEAHDSSRVLVVGGTMRGPSRPATSAALSRLMAAIPLNSLGAFALTEDGLTRYVMARKQSKPVTNWESDKLVTWNIQLSAPDHRLLAGDGSGQSFVAGPVGLPKTVGGLRLKPGGVRVRPLRVVARVTSGQLVLGTAGTASPPSLLRLRGPLPDFTITATSGDRVQVMRYTEPVPAGQFVDVDLDAKTVKINGTVSRRNKLVGSWIRPADGMVFKFDSSVQNDTASMELFASSAWR